MKLKHLNPLWWSLLFFIKFYRIFSTKFPSRCRFYPSCSQYALDALEKYGFFKASIMTITRISKCHPFHPGGVDKV